MFDKLLKKIDGFKSIFGYGALQFIDGKLWVIEAVKQLYEQGAPALSVAAAHLVLFGGLVHRFIKELKSKS